MAPLDDNTRTQIDTLVHGHPVVLFMKGTRAAPQCGFSAQVVGILDELLDSYVTVNVLADDALRENIKTYADWPTIPQLYVGGAFVGGSDIVAQMHQSGELSSTLQAAGVEVLAPPETPTVTFTVRAQDAVMASRASDEPETLRMTISRDLDHGLAFEPPAEGDFVLDIGPFQLLIDRQSARRAQGVTVDFVTTDERQGFKIDNPAEKPPAQSEPIVSTDEIPAPSIDVTAEARAQFVQALAEEDGDGPFGIRVKARRMGATRAEYELDVVDAQDKPAGAFVLDKDGFSLWVDRFSALVIDGATIDFVNTEFGAGFKFVNDKLKAGWTDPRAEQFEKLLDEEINPGIAAHGGTVQLLDLRGDTAYVLMGGGCQGCGMAGVTLEQGIKERVAQVLPSITRLVDTTDHAAGTNPYYGSV